MRSPVAWLSAALVLALSADASALTIENRLSPLNDRRPGRTSTRFIVLHTTEGALAGALDKLRRRGEAHYLVARSGRIYRIIEKDRVARHAGTSMWGGLPNLDRHSIGIEVVGYHDRALRPKQTAALKELIRQLQSVYGVSDDRVLTHSMVAYGKRNKYHKRPHRGRKRCGMNLADHRVRQALGLTQHPAFDPDVRAGRLAVADEPLAQRLFPNGVRGPKKAPPVVVAKATPKKAPPAVVEKAPVVVAKATPKKAPPAVVAKAAPKPATEQAKSAQAQAVERLIARSAHATTLDRPRPARTVAGADFAAADTIYMFPSGLIRTGATLAKSDMAHLLEELPAGTRVLEGYQNGGYVTPRRPPSVICGEKWRHPTTVYRFPNGELVAGNQVQPASIPKSTLVFFRG